MDSISFEFLWISNNNLCTCIEIECPFLFIPQQKNENKTTKYSTPKCWSYCLPSWCHSSQPTYSHTYARCPGLFQYTASVSFVFQFNVNNNSLISSIRPLPYFLLVFDRFGHSFAMAKKERKIKHSFTEHLVWISILCECIGLSCFCENWPPNTHWI